MKIHIITCDRQVARGQIHPIYRASKELKQLGYKFVDTPEQADYLFVQLTAIGREKLDFDWVLGLGKSVVMLDDAASTGTQKMWHLKKYPGKVIGYVKKQLLVDRNLYKTKYPRSRWHYFQLSKLSPQLDNVTKADNDVDDQVLSKVHLGWNLGLIERHGIDVQTKSNWSKVRDIDVHFSIKTKHSTKVERGNLGKIDDHYAFHRASCETILDEIVKRNDLTTSGKCRGPSYEEKMTRSKVCLSPLGLGEVCFRDFEAISQGAILVKPDMSHLETWPDIYQPLKTYIPVKWDWSDLESTLLDVIRNHKKYRHVVDQAFAVLANAWDNEVFAKKFDTIMRPILHCRD